MRIAIIIISVATLIGLLLHRSAEAGASDCDFYMALKTAAKTYDTALLPECLRQQTQVSVLEAFRTAVPSIKLETGFVREEKCNGSQCRQLMQIAARYHDDDKLGPGGNLVLVIIEFEGQSILVWQIFKTRMGIQRMASSPLDIAELKIADPDFDYIFNRSSSHSHPATVVGSRTFFEGSTLPARGRVEKVLWADLYQHCSGASNCITTSNVRERLLSLGLKVARRDLPVGLTRGSVAMDLYWSPPDPFLSRVCKTFSCTSLLYRCNGSTYVGLLHDADDQFLGLSAWPDVPEVGLAVRQPQFGACE